MKTLSLEQMEAVSGGRINWNSLACSVGVGLIFGVAALGGPAGVAVAALAVTTGSSVLCAVMYQ